MAHADVIEQEGMGKVEDGKALCDDEAKSGPINSKKCTREVKRNSDKTKEKEGTQNITPKARKRRYGAVDD